MWGGGGCVLSHSRVDFLLQLDGKHSGALPSRTDDQHKFFYFEPSIHIWNDVRYFKIPCSAVATLLILPPNNLCLPSVLNSLRHQKRSQHVLLRNKRVRKIIPLWGHKRLCWSLTGVSNHCVYICHLAFERSSKTSAFALGCKQVATMQLSGHPEGLQVDFISKADPGGPKRY